MELETSNGFSARYARYGNQVFRRQRLPGAEEVFIHLRVEIVFGGSNSKMERRLFIVQIPTSWEEVTNILIKPVELVPERNSH